MSTYIAPLPADEAERIKALLECGVLDTPPETEFDELTALAAAICGVPTAVVSLVDNDRQWFKSRVGLSAEETPRDLAFCAHAILSPEVMIVTDALLDPRFREHPLVTGEPQIRFYAGAPLVAPTGLAIGSLCVIDRIPRHLTNCQLDTLRDLSRHVIALLEARQYLAELEPMDPVMGFAWGPPRDRSRAHGGVRV